MTVHKANVDELIRLTKNFWCGSEHTAQGIEARYRYSERCFGEQWVAMDELLDSLFRTNGLNANVSNEVIYRILKIAGVEII